MVAGPANMTNRVMIFLFIKNLYNCGIPKRIAGAKTIPTLVDAFKLTHQSVLNLKRMKVYCTMRNMKCLDMEKETSDNNKSKFPNKNTTNNGNKTYTYLGTCLKCNEFGHISKNNPSDTKLNDQQEQTKINTYRNIHNTSPLPPVKYPTTMSLTKPQILTQQITADFKLSEEAWKQLSSQMNKMVETKNS